jgi:pimeloyl-ACP methyl ester carboxylesterase
MRWFAEEDFTEDDYRAAFEYQKKLVTLAWEGAGWDAFAPLVADARTQPWSGYVDLPDDLNNEELDYFRRRRSFDPVPALRQTTIPVLAFYGERDFVVPSPANVPKLERFLQEAGNTDFKIMVIPRADHGMTVPGGFNEEEGDWPDRYYRWRRGAPGLGDAIYTWILDHVEVTSMP